MFALWMFGIQLENSWGSQRFSIFYFVSVIGAGLVQLIVATVGPGAYATIGASGGVFGVLLAFERFLEKGLGIKTVPEKNRVLIALKTPAATAEKPV